MTTYAEELPYWKTGRSSPETWLEKCEVEIERAGGEILSSGFGRQAGKAAFLIRFELDGETFRVVWPVLESKYEGQEKNRPFLLAARRQSATMMFHDVKSSCVKARALGARVAFFAHLEIGERVASDVSGEELLAFPDLLSGNRLLEGEVVE